MLIEIVVCEWALVKGNISLDLLGFGWLELFGLLEQRGRTALVMVDLLDPNQGAHARRQRQFVVDCLQVLILMIRFVELLNCVFNSYIILRMPSESVRRPLQIRAVVVRGCWSLRIFNNFALSFCTFRIFLTFSSGGRAIRPLFFRSNLQLVITLKINILNCADCLRNLGHH